MLHKIFSFFVTKYNVHVSVSVCCNVYLFSSVSLWAIVPLSSSALLHIMYQSHTYSQWGLHNIALVTAGWCSSSLMGKPALLAESVNFLYTSPRTLFESQSRQSHQFRLFCARICVCLFGWMKCFTVHGSSPTLEPHCISLLLCCQFNLVYRLPLLQPFGCALPGISPFWSWKWEERLREETRPGLSAPMRSWCEHCTMQNLLNVD